MTDLEVFNFEGYESLCFDLSVVLAIVVHTLSLTSVLDNDRLKLSCQCLESYFDVLEA